jgi:hypothetical protein
MPTRIRDISNVNGEAAGLAAIHDPKTKAVYAKRTEGLSFVDELYPSFYAAAREIHKPIGAYGFLHPELSGAEQARFLLTHAQPKPGDLVPVIDTETLHNGDYAQCARTTLTALLELRTHGTGAMGYASSGFIEQLVAHQPALKQFAWWYADYANVLWRIPGVRALLWQNTDRLGVGRFATDGDVLLAKSLAAIEIPAHATVHHPKPKPAPKKKPAAKKKPMKKAKANTRGRDTVGAGGGTGGSYSKTKPPAKKPAAKKTTTARKKA